MKNTLKIFLLFGFIFGSLNAIFGADRALIIGIEKYKEIPRVPQVLGAENDARAFANLAEKKLGFAPTNIKVLLNQDATSANIKQAVENWLIAGTKPNDRVFLFFAGHGTQIADVNHDEADGLDEAIVPFDVSLASSQPLIIDDEIEIWLKKLIGRRVVMVFDSCYSGTIDRDLDDENSLSRFLPLPELVSKKRSIGDTDSYSPVPTDSTQRDLFQVGQNTVSDFSNNAVIISAAQPYQVANGFQLNQTTFRGSLSYLLEQQLLNNESIPIEKLEANLKSEMSNLMQSLEQRGQKVTQKVKGQEEQRYQVPSIEILSDCSRGDTTLFALADSATCKMKNPNSNVGLNFKMLNSRPVFFDKEIFNFEIELNQPMYFYMLVFSTENVVACVFPNKSDTANFLSAGKYSFPRQGTLTIKARSPWGRDVWVALATKKPLNLGIEKQLYSWDEIFQRIGNSDFQNRLKSINRSAGTDDDGKSVNLGSNEWQAASLTLETRPKP